MMTIRPTKPTERPIASRNLHRKEERRGEEREGAYRTIMGAVSLMGPIWALIL